MNNRIAQWHAWLKAHGAYFWTVLAVFPEVWIASPDLQAMLPAPLVSRIASAVAVLGFGRRLLIGLRRQRNADPTDHAGA